MRPRLRLFIGQDGPDDTEFATPDVSMELGEFTRILSDAIVQDRSWVADLADEKIKISADLYEVLTVYAQLRASA